MDQCDFAIGPSFCKYLEDKIADLNIGLIILDSYTKLRGARGAGIDIVKVESNEFAALDRLAKSRNCVILLIHHDSKGSAALLWDQKGAGTFAVAASVGGIISFERFSELEVAACERLVRVRGRQLSRVEFVVRLNERLIIATTS